MERRLLMIRSAVRKHSVGVTVLAFSAGVGLLILACETPTPPAGGEIEVPLAPPVSSVVTEAAREALKEVGEGYFLVRKKGGEVEYVRSVSPEQLEVIREEPGDEAVTLTVQTEEGPGSDASGILIGERDERPDGFPFVTGVPPEGEGAQPLIVLDGVIISDRNTLSELPPEDIEQIEVIKGAAAEAMFGERAKGGVIKITTKG